MSDYDGRRNLKITDFPKVAEKRLIDEGITRVYPRQMSTGSMRGTQTVGYGEVKIDGSNNRITIDSNDTFVTLGDISEDNDAAGLGVSDGSGTLRLLAGRFADGGVRIALSQVGIDVATATTEQLIWSSEFNMFKIVKTGSMIITHTTETSKITTYYHGLGYQPVTYCFLENTFVLPGGNGFALIPIPFSNIDIATGVVTRKVDFFVDNLNLYIREEAPTGFNVYNTTNNIRFYMMRETAA